MQRRRFLTTAAQAAALSPLGQHVGRVLHTGGSSPRRSPPRRPRPRRQVAVLLLVIPPANWRPTSWRDIPPATRGTPFVVVDRYEPAAAGVCRAVAKLHNVGQLREAVNGGIRTWAVVACNDGRFTDETKGGEA